MGDFNSYLWKDFHRGGKLKAMAEAYNLRMSLITATHSIPGFTAFLLDLSIISRLKHVCKHGQCQAEAFSHHNLIDLSYQLRPSRANVQILLQGSFDCMNMDILCYDATEIDWFSIIQCESVDIKIKLFNYQIKKLYNIHVSIKPIKIKHLLAPWLIDSCDAILHKFKTVRNQQHLNQRCSNVNL